MNHRPGYSVDVFDVALALSSRVCNSQDFSAGESQGARPGWSERKNQAAKPSRIAGMASRRNIHCQLARPPRWFQSSSKPEIGQPITPETGPAVMNSATTPARALAGNQERR